MGQCVVEERWFGVHVAEFVRIRVDPPSNFDEFGYGNAISQA